MLNNKIKEWLYKFNLDNKLFYSNFTMSKIDYTIKNYIFKNIYFQNIDFKDNNKIYNVGIKSNFFFEKTSLSKWDYILENYFNHFDINKFSKILLINIKNIDYKNKIKNFYNVENLVFDNLKTNIKLSKKYDLISIFPYDYKMSNQHKNFNKIIFNLLEILYNISDQINNKTVIHIYYIHYLSANNLDFIFLLENFFDLTFFSEYKLQDIDKTSIDIILCNGRDLKRLKNDLFKIISIFEINSNNIGFIKYEFIPKNSSIFLYIKLCDFLNKRYLNFINLNITVNDTLLTTVYNELILNKIFTQDIKNTNVIQLPMFIKILNKNSKLFFKEGNIIYNFIIKQKLSKIFQFGFYNGYLSIFILTALNKLKNKNQILISIDFNVIDNEVLKNINIFKNHLLIKDYIYNYVPKLIAKKKKFHLIILHNILKHNFNHLMMEFYFALHLVKKNGFIYLEKINYPKIKKMVLYIKKNLHFLNIYYENFFRNIIIFKIKNYDELNNYLYIKNNKFIDF